MKLKKVNKAKRTGKRMNKRRKSKYSRLALQRQKIVFVLFLFLFATLGAALLHISRAATPSIVDYIKKPGGQEVVVPCGTYVGGTVNVAHSDWLILKAPTKGCVTIDMSTTGLFLYDDTTKVVFVGMKFIKGMIWTQGVEDIKFWYTEHSFSPEEWDRQYQAAGGVPFANATDKAKMETLRNKMANHFPTVSRSRRDITTNARPKNIQWYGSDMHHLGDDAVWWNSVENVKVVGSKIWHITQYGGCGVSPDPYCFTRGTNDYDPGKALNPSGDWWHNDSFQTSNGNGLAITDSSWDYHPFVGGDNSSVQNFEIARDWGYGYDKNDHRSDKKSIYLMSRNPEKTVTGTIQSFRTFNVEQAIIEQKGPTDGKYVQDGATGLEFKYWPQSFNDTARFPAYIPSVAGAASEENFPSGISAPNGVLSAQMQKAVLDHPQNPANVWRAAHPYESYKQYLGINVGSSTPAPQPAPSPTPTPAPAPSPTPAPATNSDLVITSVGITPTGAKAGEVVRFTVTMKNQGSGATPSDVKHGVMFELDGQAIAWNDTHFSSLAPGASVTLTSNGFSAPRDGSWTAVAGSHKLKALADAYKSNIAESNESNNGKEENITISAGAAAGDTTKPNKPASLSASLVTSSSIVVDWDNSTDDTGVVGYNVTRNGAKIATAVNSAYTSSNLQADTNYSFTVSAYDANGNVSDESSQLSVKTSKAQTAPAQPPESSITSSVSTPPPVEGGSSPIAVVLSEAGDPVPIPANEKPTLSGTVKLSNPSIQPKDITKTEIFVNKKLAATAVGETAAELDTTKLQNGTYGVEVVTTTKDGAVVTSGRYMTVNNPQSFRRRLLNIILLPVRVSINLVRRINETIRSWDWPF